MARMLVLGTLVGGTVAWVWGAISWMALPWQRATFLAFRDQDAVARAIAENAPRSGMYGIPVETDADAESRLATGPLVLAAVRREGFGPAIVAMIGGWAVYALGSLLISGLLLHAAPLPYLGRALFVCVAALAGTLVCRLGDWNWHCFAAGYTLVRVADVAIGWFLVGLAISGIVRP